MLVELLRSQIYTVLRGDSMIEMFKVKTSLDEFERIVLASKNQNNQIYIGHSFYYGGREGAEYLLFLYKDPLPAGNFLTGWNILDETSLHITIVDEKDHQTAVEDFLCCQDPNLTMEDITFIPIRDFSEVDDIMNQIVMKPGQAVGFVIKK